VAMSKEKAARVLQHTPCGQHTIPFLPSSVNERDLVLFCSEYQKEDMRQHRRASQMQIHFPSPITKVNGGEQRPNNVPPRLQRRRCSGQPVREARRNRNNVLQAPHGLATETRAPRRRVSDYAEES